MVENDFDFVRLATDYSCWTPASGNYYEPPLYNNYVAVYDRDYTATIPAGTHEIQIAVGRGDWLTFSEIRIDPYSGAPGRQAVLQATDPQWAVRQAICALDEMGGLTTTRRYGKEDLRRDEIEPWQAFARTGIGVHVGEFR